MINPVKKQFLQLIQDHQGILHSICQVYYTNEEDRKDARQNIILQLWKAWPQFRADAKVSTWIYKVALNTVLAQIRNQGRRPKNVPLAELPETLKQLPATDDNLQQLLQIISLLREQEKAVIILHLEGYSHKEIAEMLHTSATNISTRMNRIKNKMKNLYKSYSDESK